MSRRTLRFGDRRRLVAVGLAVVAGLTAWLVSTQLFPFHSLNHDEGVYLNQAAMLLDGRLTIRPPVPEAFRPWFFVERPDGRLYPKYAPVPAAMFAVGTLFGGFRLALPVIAAGVTLLTYAVTTELFDRTRGVVAAVVVVVSPLFLLQSGVFLPYLPTTLWNLLFAYAYLRADRLAQGDTDDRQSAGDDRPPARVETGAVNERRRDPLGPTGWAAIAGLAVGIAFFARPYTAVLFAAPFIGHALWTIWAREPQDGFSGERTRLLGWIDHSAVRRQSATAALGLLGVATALAYNAVLTGSPTRFPYQAFAPLDGIGFGRREILGYSRIYTPALAVRANAAVVSELFGRWVAGGPIGTLLAGVGLAALARRVLRASTGSSVVERVAGAVRTRLPGTRRVGTRSSPVSTAGGSSTPGTESLASRAVTARRLAMAGTFLTVIVGNVAFWGNLNVLGAIDARNGLIAALGPYYHMDLVVTTAVFAADGAVRLARVVERRASPSSRAESNETHAEPDETRAEPNENRSTPLARQDTRAVLTRAGRVTLVVLLVVGIAVPSAVFAADPVERNADVTRTYESVYAVDPPDDAVVFLPTPLGDWLAHPYQAFRNDPTFDDGTVYALPEREFAVAEAFPDRRLYRYGFRGPWQPLAGTEVTPHLQRVRVREGETVDLRLSLGVPNETKSVSIRASDANDAATFAVAPDGRLPETLSLRLRVAADGETAVAELDGPLQPVGGDRLALTGRTAITLRVFADTGTGAGVTYRIVLPVRVEDGTVTALTPELEACERPQLCGGEATYVPGASPGSMNATLVAGPDNSTSVVERAGGRSDDTVPTSERDGWRDDRARTTTLRALVDAPYSVVRDANGGWMGARAR